MHFTLCTSNQDLPVYFLLLCNTVNICRTWFSCKIQVDSESHNEGSQKEADDISKDEVMVFHENCCYCNSPADTRMKVVGILL